MLASDIPSCQYLILVLQWPIPFNCLGASPKGH